MASYTYDKYSSEDIQLSQPRNAWELVYAADESGEKNALLGGDTDDYLTRGRAALLVGPTGVGKSSASTQMDMLWSMGRQAFGIMPAKPLKILTVQAENDEGDAADVPRFMIDALQGEFAWMGKHFAPGTEEELQLFEKNYIHFTERVRGTRFLKWLDVHLEKYRPDLVRIDPLFSFIDFDPQDTASLSSFLRDGVSDLLEHYECGAFMNHHTPKTAGKDTSKLSDLDFAYMGAGAAELANWARAIVTINQTGAPGVFDFIAAKRGKRIGWRDEDGLPQTRRAFMQSAGGHLFWQDADAGAKKSAKAKRGKVDAGKVMEGLVPKTGAIEKNDLLAKMEEAGAGGKARAHVQRMVDADAPVFYEWKEAREGGGRKRVFIGRQPRAEPSVPDSPPDDGGEGKAKARKARS